VSDDSVEFMRDVGRVFAQIVADATYAGRNLGSAPLGGSYDELQDFGPDPPALLSVGVPVFPLVREGPASFAISRCQT
jgi:hypothetical protein